MGVSKTTFSTYMGGDSRGESSDRSQTTGALCLRAGGKYSLGNALATTASLGRFAVERNCDGGLLADPTGGLLAVRPRSVCNPAYSTQGFDAMGTATIEFTLGAYLSNKSCSSEQASIRSVDCFPLGCSLANNRFEDPS